MKFYILAPAGVTSGGPELAHQMCEEINKNGYEALMYYVYANSTEPVDTESVEKFRKYNTRHVSDKCEADRSDNIIVVPEGLADWAYVFTKARVVLWWMSVDNYYRDAVDNDIKKLDEKIFLHLTQSEYAREHLVDNEIADNKIMTVSDYISDMYGQFIFPADYRKNIALYNPKKIEDDLEYVMNNTPFLEWKPLINMTEEEMIVMMELAKVYVDFGSHPGKDRIPREAALCGCCVVTNMRGSARNAKDVPISSEYKIDIEANGYDGVVSILRKITEQYEECMKEFNDYRLTIKCEHELFVRDVNSFVKRCNV